MGMEFSDLEDTPAKAAVMTWLSKVKAGGVIKSPGSPLAGYGVLLVGKPGHGKTTLASVTLQELIRTIPSDMRSPLGIFLDYPSFLDKKKSQFDAFNIDEKRKLDSIYGRADKLNVSVFILDDVGKEYRTSNGWSDNLLDELLRSRFRFGLPTIVTTNTPPMEWSKYGEAMASFISEAFITIEVKAPGGDRRKNG
jgi:DNA replication protein DnaC